MEGRKQQREGREELQGESGGIFIYATAAAPTRARHHLATTGPALSPDNRCVRYLGEKAQGAQPTPPHTQIKTVASAIASLSFRRNAPQIPVK